MEQPVLSVREITAADVSPLINYWLSATDEYLAGMGAMRAKMPSRPEWEQIFADQLAAGYPDKKAYCIIWLVNGVAVGHSNVNKIVFGKEAYMHLHLWNAAQRSTGYGAQLVKLTIPYFFRNLQLETLYCEPYALNPAPNKTLPRAGFRLVNTYTTTPGFLNFEQQVNLWEISRRDVLGV